MDLTTPSNAPFGDGEEQTFQIIHPFHPLNGKTFALVTYRHNWGEDRVYYHDDRGKLCLIPASWTSVFPTDPFVVIAEGRSRFRVADLLKLSRLIDGIVVGRIRDDRGKSKKGV